MKAAISSRSGVAKTKSTSPDLSCSIAAWIPVGRVRVDLRGDDAKLMLACPLVLHERDQRRDDDRRAWEIQRGQLVTEGLAGAGRHDRDRVVTLHDRLNDGLLSGSEFFKPETSLA